jgi:hypothetical protein
MFSIDFAPDAAYPFDGTGALHRDAVITMDDFSERFAVPLDYWAETDYQRQWQEGARRLVDGAPASLLLTRVEDPTEPQPIYRWWSLYRRDGDAVTVQEQLWVSEDLGYFDPASPYAAVHPYPSGPAQMVSEWDLILGDFREFLAR